MRIAKKIGDGLHWLASRRERKGAILLYHRVAVDRGDAFKLCVSPNHFEEQMKYLADSRRAIPLLELVERQRQNQIEDSPIAVTFDDGYLDNLETALPILERYQIPATIFAVSGTPGEPFWWDHLARLIYQAEELPKFISPPPSNLSNVSFSGRNFSRQSIFNFLHEDLRHCSKTERKEYLKSLEEELSLPESFKVPRSMNKEELTQLAQHPLITIGAHTVSHSRLTHLEPNQQHEEVHSSREALARTIGQPIQTFSYPFGLKKRDYSDDTIHAVREAGLHHALAADLGVVTGNSNAFALPRLWIHDIDKKQFSRRLQLWLGRSLHSTT
ncbi:MAG: polysaccharide deacetylase family protein [Verrucomicrobiota bacterium]